MNTTRKLGSAVTAPAPSAQSLAPRIRSSRKLGLALAVAMLISLYSALDVDRGQAGERVSGYEVLTPISHGNLTIFPVVTSSARLSHDTRNFLTLDEGLRSGEVVVTEAGRVAPLMRQRPRPVRPYHLPPWTERPFPYEGGAQVNRLVLVNNSDRPLILLAGDIVTGGKQDRVVAKDRIVSPKSEPIDLSVFCVEPGRWVEKASNFKSLDSAMAQPSVRRRAMVDKNQQEVWTEVHRSAAGIGGGLSPSSARALESTSSYAGVMGNQDVKRQLDAVAAPIERSYENLIHELRARKAVGVVVAVNGEIIWADLFASTSLLEKYWPKLIRSYAAEAITNRVASSHADVKSAQAFLENFQGRRESVESEPGVYRHTEISGDSFTAFELTSLLPGTGFDIHVAKMLD